MGNKSTMDSDSDTHALVFVLLSQWIVTLQKEPLG